MEMCMSTSSWQVVAVSGDSRFISSDTLRYLAEGVCDMAATQPQILEHVGARLLREAFEMSCISQHG